MGVLPGEEVIFFEVSVKYMTLCHHKYLITTNVVQNNPDIAFQKKP